MAGKINNNNNSNNNSNSNSNNNNNNNNNNSSNMDDFTTRGTMLEALLTSKVGDGRAATEVAPETLGMLQLLQGKLITTENMDRLLVSKEQVLVALVRQMLGVGMAKQVQSLVNGVTSEEGMAALPWKNGVMAHYAHDEVPASWQLHTDGCLDKNGDTRLEVEIQKQNEAGAKLC